VAGRPFSHGVIAAASAAWLAGCVLFTDDINGVPAVRVNGPSTLERGKAVVFEAVANDPDQVAESLRIEWRWAQADDPCPKTLDEAKAAGVLQPTDRVPTMVTVTPSVVGNSCVWAVVRDGAGAAAFDAHPAKVEPGELKSEIVVNGPPGAGETYALYGQLRLSAKLSGSAPNDVLISSWTVTGPGGQAVTKVFCGDKDFCFTALTPGDHLAQLTVRDQMNGMATAMKTVKVDEDRPPCIEQTTPPFYSLALPVLKWERDEQRPIELHAVSDDGDPFPEEAPGSRHTIVWSYRRSTDTEFTRWPPSASNQIPFPPVAVAPGDTLFVRLEYRDRVTRDFSTCTDATPNCQLPNVRDPSRPCFQRVSWQIELR
jgi:hypothetical protein